MPRTKKSGSGQPRSNQDPSTADESDSATKAHVSAHELAGSPDIFARKSAAARRADTPADDAASTPSTADEPASIAEPASVTSEPLASPTVPPAASAEPPAASAEPPDASAEPPDASAEPPDASAEPPAASVEPTPPVQPALHAVPITPPPARRGGSGIALGVVLVVVGAFYLVVQLAGVDLSSFGWPLFIIIPGLTLLIVGFVSLGTGAAIPGGILTMVGLVLAYQNSTGYWTSWAYAWALVAPGGVGLGLFLQGLRERNGSLIRQGRSLMFIAALIFMVGFVFFESILNISGINDQPLVKAALPALFIVIGILLLGRSIQNSRRA